MPTPVDPDEEPIRSGREFDERMFPPVAPHDPGSRVDLNPEELGARAAEQAIERLRTGPGPPTSAPVPKRAREDR
jgi:hypothetical protein